MNCEKNENFTNDLNTFYKSNVKHNILPILRAEQESLAALDFPVSISPPGGNTLYVELREQKVSSTDQYIYFQAVCRSQKYTILEE